MNDVFVIGAGQVGPCRPVLIKVSSTHPSWFA